MVRDFEEYLCSLGCWCQGWFLAWFLVSLLEYVLDLLDWHPEESRNVPAIHKTRSLRCWNNERRTSISSKWASSRYLLACPAWECLGVLVHRVLSSVVGPKRLEESMVFDKIITSSRASFSFPISWYRGAYHAQNQGQGRLTWMTRRQSRGEASKETWLKASFLSFLSFFNSYLTFIQSQIQSSCGKPCCSPFLRWAPSVVSWPLHSWPSCRMLCRTRVAEVVFRQYLFLSSPHKSLGKSNETVQVGKKIENWASAFEAVSGFVGSSSSIQTFCNIHAKKNFAKTSSCLRFNLTTRANCITSATACCVAWNLLQELHCGPSMGPQRPYKQKSTLTFSAFRSNRLKISSPLRSLAIRVGDSLNT